MEDQIPALFPKILPAILFSGKFTLPKFAVKASCDGGFNTGTKRYCCSLGDMLAKNRSNPNGTTCFKKCKQLFEYQHLLLL